MPQTVFIIRKGRIVEVAVPKKRILLIRQQKKCKYCGKPFTPQHNRQTYCNKECSHKAEQDHTLIRVRTFRKRYHDILDQLTYRSLGTGGLGQHTTGDWEEEQRKIRQEMKIIGIT